MKFCAPFLALTLLLICSIVVCGQTEKKAYKLAEFGPMSQSKMDEKMRELCLAVRKDPSSQGYIMNYGTPNAIRRAVTF